MTRTNHDEKCGHETSLTIREALLLKQEKDASVPSFVLHFLILRNNRFLFYLIHVVRFMSLSRLCFAIFRWFFTCLLSVLFHVNYQIPITHLRAARNFILFQRFQLCVLSAFALIGPYLQDTKRSCLCTTSNRVRACLFVCKPTRNPLTCVRACSVVSALQPLSNKP